MNTETLTAELANDPLGRGYSGMNDAEAAVSLNTANRTRRKLVPRWLAKQAIYEAGEWPLLLAGQANATPQIAGAAVTAVAFLGDSDFENIDMDRVGVKTMLGALVAGGVLSGPLATAVDALANETISRAAELGLLNVGPHHIEYARAN